MIRPADVAREARTWLGVPYVHQGRGRFGVDCIGLIICVRLALGPVHDWADEPRNYARIPKNDLLLQRVEKYCIRLGQTEEGCLILIRWPNMPQPSHAGFFASGNILHAYQRAGKVIETGYRAHWSRDTHSLWRLPGVTAP